RFPREPLVSWEVHPPTPCRAILLEGALLGEDRFGGQSPAQIPRRHVQGFRRRPGRIVAGAVTWSEGGFVAHHLHCFAAHDAIASVTPLHHAWVKQAWLKPGGQRPRP